MDDECRKAFEGWAELNLDNPRLELRRNKQGEYPTRTVNGAWIGWKARAAWKLRQPVVDNSISDELVSKMLYAYGKQECLTYTFKSLAAIAQAPLRDELQALRQQLERAEAALQVIHDTTKNKWYKEMAREALKAKP